MKQITIFATCHDSIEKDIFCFFNTIAKKLNELNGELILSGNEPLKMIKQKNTGNNFYFKYIQLLNHYDEQVNLLSDDDLKNIIGINISDLSKNDFNLKHIDKDILIDAHWADRNAKIEASILGKSILENRFEKFLKIIKPSVCLIWSSNIFPQSITLKKICESLSIPNLSIENGWLDGTMMIDNVGIGSNNQFNLSQLKNNLLKNNDEKFRIYEKWFNETTQKKNLIINNKLFSEAVINKKSIVTCLLPLQSTAYNHFGDNAKIDPIIKELTDMLTSVNELKDVEIFFKLHPFDYSYYKEYFPQHQLLDNSEDTNSIISYSTVIISADSKTTYLSMMRNKQVFLYKKSFASNLFPKIYYEEIEDLKSELLFIFKKGMKRRTSYVRGLSFLLNEYLYKKNPKYFFGKDIDSLVSSISSNFRHNSNTSKINLDGFFSSIVSSHELKEICRSNLLVRDLNDSHNLRLNKNLEGANKNLEGDNKNLEVANKNLEVANKNLEVANKNLEGANKNLEGDNKNLEVANKNLEAKILKYERNIFVRILKRIKAIKYD